MIDFNRKIQRDAKRIELAKLLATKSRGDIVTYEEIAVAVKPEDPRSFRSSIRKLIMDRLGAVIESIANVGYKIATAEGHLSVAGRHRDRSRSQTRKESIALATTPVLELDDESKRLHTHMSLAVGTRMSLLDQQRKELRGGMAAPLPRLVGKAGR